MSEQALKHYKAVYKQIAVSDQTIQTSWEQLRQRLPERQPKGGRQYFRAAFLFALLVLFFVIGTVGAAQAARPGDLLYPVRVFSDTVAARMIGKPEIIIEKRGQDLIDELKKNPPREETEKSSQRIEKAAEVYQKTLEQMQKDVKGSQTQRKEINNTIASQAGKLKQLKPNNPQAEKILNKAIQNTEKTKDEVEHPNNGNSENKGQSNNTQEEQQNNGNNGNRNSPQAPKKEK